MTGIERLREFVAGINPITVVCGVTKTSYDREHKEETWARLRDFLSDIADQIERERECESDTIENLRLELGEARDDAAWVREHGGLDIVKELFDWVVGHCSTKQQLDFDFWLSGRVMHELGFDEDMADRDEVERRLRDRLMPEGMTWPHDAKGVPIVRGETVWANGSDSGDGRAWHVSRVCPGSAYPVDAKDARGERRDLKPRWLTHERPAPKVLAADGEPLEVGQTVWDTKGNGPYNIQKIENDGVIRIDGRGLDYFGSEFVHERPESWERLEEDCAKSDVDYCAERGLLDPSCDTVEGDASTRHCTDCGCTCGEKMARDLVRRAKKLAGVSE